MSTSFEQGAVIITGGNKGIGLSIAEMFAAHTSRPIVLVARNEEELREARQICLDKGAEEVHTLSVDLTDAAAVQEIDLGDVRPCVLVNNAGSFLFKPLEDTDAAEFEKQFQINAFGAFNMTKKVLPLLKERDRAMIVNICSQASLKRCLPFP